MAFCIHAAIEAGAGFYFGEDVGMRLILLIIVIIAIAAVVQTKRHNCEFGGKDWFSCVVDNTRKEYYSFAAPDSHLAQAGSEDLRASAM